MQNSIQESRVGLGADGSSTMALVVEGAVASGETPSNNAEALMAVLRIQVTIHVNWWSPISTLVYDEAACTHGRVRGGGSVIVIYHATFAECMAIYSWMAEAATRKTPPKCCVKRTALNLRLGRSRSGLTAVRVLIYHGAGAAADVEAR